MVLGNPTNVEARIVFGFWVFPACNYVFHVCFIVAGVSIRFLPTRGASGLHRTASHWRAWGGGLALEKNEDLSASFN